jgi:N6-adenosine-specific RNA methylase IME4
VTWFFSPLRQLHYGIILADPNWRFDAWGKTEHPRGPERHYTTSPFEWMCSLPVHLLAAENSVCVIWGTQAQFELAYILMRAWGFVDKSAGGWAKRSKTGTKWAFGTGYIQRSTLEFYLIGTIGTPKQAVHNVRNMIEAPVREHSRKPDEMHENLERMYPGVPKCELFARQSRPGWDTWGDERTKFDEVTAC